MYYDAYMFIIVNQNIYYNGYKFCHLLKLCYFLCIFFANDEKLRFKNSDKIF